MLARHDDPLRRMRSVPAEMLALAAGVAALPALVSGCGAVLRDAAGEVAEEVPERATEGSLTALEDEETQRRMVALLESPELRDAMQALVAGMVDGSLDALGEEERAERVAQAADGFVLAISRSVGRALDREIGPALAAAVSRTVEASLATLTRDENLERVGALVTALARDTVAAMVVAMREELGPALREALEDEATRRALADTAREISSAIVLGTQDGLQQVEADAQRDREPESLLSRVTSFARDGLGLAETALVVLAIALIALSLWLVRSTGRHRRLEAEAQKREAAVLALTAILREGGAAPRELLDSIARSMDTPAKRSRVREILRRPPAGGTPQPT